MKQWKISFARVPWSGEWTSFCAHCDVTCRDQLTASCSCQTVHRRDHWYRALTNDPHQLRTDLENILVRLSVRSRLNVPMILFYTTSTKRSSYGNESATNQFLQIVPSGEYLSRFGHKYDRPKVLVVFISLDLCHQGFQHPER